MTQTIADALREEGRQEGAVEAWRQSLLELIRARFGRVPRAAGRRIRSTADPEQLRAWVARVGTASSLEEAGISPEPPD
jgi:hypothetical protein